MVKSDNFDRECSIFSWKKPVPDSIWDKWENLAIIVSHIHFMYTQPPPPVPLPYFFNYSLKLPFPIF